MEKFDINVEDIRDRIIMELSKVKREGMEELIDYLKKSDFFYAPASTIYHMNVRGGLAYHSWSVYKLLRHKNKAYQLEIPEETVILTALCHDLCKVNVYYQTNKPVKDDVTGKWSTKKVYAFKDEMPLGHGSKSVIILQEFIKLTKEEQLMILHHMGPCGASDKELKDFNAAIEMCPWVGAIHVADCESGWFFEYTNKD